MTSISVPALLYAEAVQHLDSRPEEVGFFLAEWEPNPQRFAVREWRAIASDGLEVQTDYHVSLTDEMSAEIIKWAWDERMSLIDFASGKVKHVRNAVLLGMAAAGLADPELAGPPSADAADAARAYLVHLAFRQSRTGADWLDVNVDEVAGDLAMRVAAMDWIVRVLEAAPEVTIPIALDSPSSEVLRAGLAASASPHGRLLLNSASLERPDVLGLAAAHGCPLVISAAGKDSLPATADGRVANTEIILAEASRQGIPLADCYLDPLVMPAGLDPEAGAALLDAATRIRAAYGPELHITGGLSNVSFGLPGRRLLNDVFLVLAMDAGVDSGIIDPVVADTERILGLDRAARAFRLTEDLLLGRDPYGMEFLTAYRAGVFAEALA